MWATRLRCPSEASCPQTCFRSRLLALHWFGPAQALAGEIDAVGIVDEAIHDCVGIGRVSDELMPTVHRDLTGDDDGAAAVALFEDFEEIVTRSGIERVEAPVIEDEEIDTTDGAQQASMTTVTAGKREFGEQSGDALIQDRAIVAACLVSERGPQLSSAA